MAACGKGMEKRRKPTNTAALCPNHLQKISAVKRALELFSAWGPRI